eukprot:scaffold108162_cov28-Tisochrysis_lutea.AAC.5
MFRWHVAYGLAERHLARPEAGLSPTPSKAGAPLPYAQRDNWQCRPRGQPISWQFCWCLLEARRYTCPAPHASSARPQQEPSIASGTRACRVRGSPIRAGFARAL